MNVMEFDPVVQGLYNNPLGQQFPTSETFFVYISGSKSFFSNAVGINIPELQILRQFTVHRFFFFGILSSS